MAVFGRDGCVRFERLTLRIEADGERPHYVKAKGKVRRHADGACWCGTGLGCCGAAKRSGRRVRALGGGRPGGLRVPPLSRRPARSLHSLRRGGRGWNRDRETEQLVCSKPDKCVCCQQPPAKSVDARQPRPYNARRFAHRFGLIYRTSSTSILCWRALPWGEVAQGSIGAGSIGRQSG